MKQIANVLLEAGAVKLSPGDPFTFASGVESPVYCDNRILLSYPKKRETVVEAFLELLRELDFEVLAGTATAGIPWCAWLADKLRKPMVYVRSEAKGHGRQNRIEGVLENGMKALVVEDLVSTGGSSISAVEALREEGAVVTDCVAIFSYELEKSVKKFEEASCRLHVLTGLTELLESAIEGNYITDEQKRALLEWQQDPDGWGER